MLNADGRLWVDRLDEPMRPVGKIAAPSAESLIATVASMPSGAVTRENPILECELPDDSQFDGSQFEALRGGRLVFCGHYGAWPPTLTAPFVVADGSFGQPSTTIPTNTRRRQRVTLAAKHGSCGRAASTVVRGRSGSPPPRI
jgi:hypothetical protein